MLGHREPIYYPFHGPLLLRFITSTVAPGPPHYSCFPHSPRWTHPLRAALDPAPERIPFKFHTVVRGLHLEIVCI